MAASETGAQGWVFGKGALSSTSFPTAKCEFQNIKWNKAPGVKVDLKDMDGKVITRRRDDKTLTLSASLKVKSDFTELEIGSPVVMADCQLDAVNGSYQIENVGASFQLGDNTTYEVELIASEGISL